MKKLLALLLAALALFSMPVPRTRGAEDEPPVVEVTPAPMATEAPQPAITPEPVSATPEPRATEVPEQPAATPEPEQPAPATPEPQQPEPSQTPGEAVETEEPAHDKPKYKKSLEYWEEERQSLVLSGSLREDILTVARAQIGYSADGSCYELDKNGKKRYYTRYGAWDGSRFCDWCDAFVSFCVYYGGQTSYPKESSCARHMNALKRLGYWREWNAYIPRKGDIVFFALNRAVMPNHVGIVEEVVLPADGKPGYLVTIEGNQSNPNGSTPCVRRMTRSLESVIGYGTYDKDRVYPEGASIRPKGVEVIDADSKYFVEYPTREALRFLGMDGTSYYAYWFPEEPEADETVPQPELPQPNGNTKA